MYVDELSWQFSISITEIYCPEEVVFNHPQLSKKQSRPSHCNVMFFFLYTYMFLSSGGPTIIEAKTSQFHSNEIDNRLFHSCIGEHKFVCSNTIPRWLKNTWRNQELMSQFFRPIPLRQQEDIAF